jgi:AcrR family transcriptional regulator
VVVPRGPSVRKGGRSARVQEAIFLAITDLLNSHALGDLSIPLIAKRAGVQPSTIYRRWGGLTALLAEASMHAETWDEVQPISGDFEHDLKRWAQGYLQRVSSERGRMVLLQDVQNVAAPVNGPGRVQMIQSC